MTISSKPFGALPDGRKATLYTLSDSAGVTASITNYGGIVTSIHTPDRSGNPGEITLGFDSVEKYVPNNNYYGSVIGRVASRIARGRFTLDGKEYVLPANSAGCTLHGGNTGFNQKLWTADIDADSLVLTLLSPDGDENFPGNLAATVRYSLANRDLVIDYTATADAPTPVNMTNHTFFNLNGGGSSVLDHELFVDADACTTLDSDLIPTGAIDSVKNTPFDFTTEKPVGRDMGSVPGGYDLNYIVNNPDPGAWNARVHDPATGRTLALATTEPCIQLYTGNFIDGSDIGHNGIRYARHHGLCLEAQRYPDAVNQPAFPSIILRPGETYRQTTVYRFGVR